MSAALPEGYCDAPPPLLSESAGFNVTTAVAARSDSAQTIIAALKTGDFSAFGDLEALQPLAMSYLAPTAVLLVIVVLALLMYPYLACKVCRAKTCCGPKPGATVSFYGRARLGGYFGVIGLCTFIAAAQGMANVGSLGTAVNLTFCAALGMVGDVTATFKAITDPLDKLAVTLPRNVDSVVADLDAAPDSPALWAELDAAVLAYKVRCRRPSLRRSSRARAPHPVPPGPR